MTDLNDDIPERSMRWRRWIAIAVVTFCLAVVWFIVGRLAGPLLILMSPALLVEVIKWLIGFAGFVLTLYFTGATANDLTAMVAAFRIRIGLGRWGGADTDPPRPTPPATE